MTTLFKALVTAAGLIVLPSVAALAADPYATHCRQSTQDGPPKLAPKQRLFERSAEPSNDHTPAILRATGMLAMKALAAPVQLTRWIKSKSDRTAAERSD